MEHGRSGWRLYLPLFYGSQSNNMSVSTAKQNIFIPVLCKFPQANYSPIAGTSTHWHFCVVCGLVDTLASTHLSQVVSPSSAAKGTVTQILSIYSHTMARKCSHCGNYGHNSRTCGLGHREIMLCEAGNNGGAASSGLRLFGVQVHVGAGTGGGGGVSMMKKSYSMDCLQLAAAAAAAPGCSLVSPSSSSSSSMLLSIDEGLERAAANGYLSDGPHGRVVQERKKGNGTVQVICSYVHIDLMVCVQISGTFFLKRE